VRQAATSGSDALPLLPRSTFGTGHGLPSLSKGEKTRPRRNGPETFRAAQAMDWGTLAIGHA